MVRSICLLDEDVMVKKGWCIRWYKGCGHWAVLGGFERDAVYGNEAKGLLYSKALYDRRFFSVHSRRRADPAYQAWH